MGGIRNCKKRFLPSGSTKLVERWTKCTEKEGEYVEKLQTLYF